MSSTSLHRLCQPLSKTRGQLCSAENYPMSSPGSWFVLHWATWFLLSSAASWTSSQLMPIFLRSFLTTSFQFCHGRPGLLLKPSGSHVRACRGSLWWSIRERCPSHLRRLSASDNVFQHWKCSCLSDFLICYFVLRKSPGYFVAIFEFFFFICVTETGHSSALLSNV